MTPFVWDTTGPLHASRCDRVNGGKVVESGRALDVIRNPQDPYTQRLLAAIPNPFADVAPPVDVA